MSVFNKLSQWWKDRTKMYILLRPRTSEVMISKKLFESILSDHPGKTDISVLFARINNGSSFKTYSMFFNPEWEKHGVDDPRSILTIPVTIGKFGHIGFQAIQPSVEEILTVYNMNHDDDDKWYTIYVSKEILNEEPYYMLKR